MQNPTEQDQRAVIHFLVQRVVKPRNSVVVWRRMFRPVQQGTICDGRPGQALVATPAGVVKVKDSVLAAAGSIFLAFSPVDSGQTKTSRRQLCSGSKSYAGSSFLQGFIRWCVSGVSDSRTWELLVNGFYSIQNTPKSGLINFFRDEIWRGQNMFVSCYYLLSASHALNTVKRK